MSADYKLFDNKDKQQYEFHIDGYIPKIEYTKSGNDTIYLKHAEVPAALEGKGIGSELVKKALTDIENQNLRVIPVCPFIDAYIQRHPEWKHLII